MLCVKPVDDEKRYDDALLSASGENPRVLAAEENGNTLGFVVVDPRDGILDLTYFDITDCADYKNPSAEEREIAEYLVRAAGSYALNRMILKMSSEITEIFDILEGFGFDTSEKSAEILISKLFKKCDGCQKNQA